MHYPYIIERGQRLEPEPSAPSGFAKHVLETRESLRIVEDLDAEAKRHGSGDRGGLDAEIGPVRPRSSSAAGRRA